MQIGDGTSTASERTPIPCTLRRPNRDRLESSGSCRSGEAAREVPSNQGIVMKDPAEWATDLPLASSPIIT
jgi:hypothetical protein